jgi:hypothetical protein
MKSKITSLTAVLAVTLFAVTSFADMPKKHENKTPINDVAAEGIQDTNAAVQEGDLSHEQGHKLKRKHVKIEKAEQKNADLRHGLVAKGDQAKFNKKARHVNAEREKVIEKNAEKKAEENSEENKQ